MKNTIKAYSYSIIFTFLSTFLFSLLLATLKQFNLISYNLNSILITIISLIIFFFAGFILGIKKKSKGLINGIILSIIYLCFTLLINNDFNFVTSLSKIVIILLGTLFGVNLNKTN